MATSSFGIVNYGIFARYFSSRRVIFLDDVSIMDFGHQSSGAACQLNRHGQFRGGGETERRERLNQ